MAGDYPSFDDIIQKGAPPEWAPFVFISGFLVLGMIAVDIYVMLQHKKYSTKLPIQFISTVGILQVYPFYALMQFIGLVVPNAHDTTIFFTEGYESLSFLFFLRLLLTYMGGKKATKTALKGDEMHLNIPPLCCLICLPKVKFTRRFFHFCEFLIVLYALFCICVGFVELIITLDGSDTYPGTVVSGRFGTVYHILLVILLFFAIYGLSGVYHSAEDRLKHRGIVKKFLVYKIFTLAVKLEDAILGSLVSYDVIDKEAFKYNEQFSAGLRTRNIFAFAVVIQALIFYPLAIKFYSTKDYIAELEMEENEKNDEKLFGDNKKAITALPEIKEQHC